MLCKGLRTKTPGLDRPCQYQASLSSAPPPLGNPPPRTAWGLSRRGFRPAGTICTTTERTTRKHPTTDRYYKNRHALLNWPFCMSLSEPSRTLAKISCLAPVLEGPLGGLCPRQAKSQTIPLMTTEMSSDQTDTRSNNSVHTCFGRIHGHFLWSCSPPLLPASTQSASCEPTGKMGVVEALDKRLPRALLVPRVLYVPGLASSAWFQPGHPEVEQNGAYRQHRSSDAAQKQICVLRIIWHSCCQVAGAWTPGPE